MDFVIKTVRQRIAKGDHELFGFVDEKNRMTKYIQNAYKNSISDSLLVIGKKGTGKTHLMRSVLEGLRGDEDFAKNMHCVHLNGLIQTDDKKAIKSIGQQLKVSLEDDEKEVMNSQRIGDVLSHILTVLSSGNDDNKSLLFIIEEFDLFLKNHNQMLIYNLVNFVHTIGTPICVIGLTSRLDVVELMEKRVTSRFSRCHINLTSYTHNFGLYLEAAKQLLLVNSNDNKLKTTINKWNKTVNLFLSDQDVQAILEQNYLISNTISKLKLILMIPVSRLSDSQPTLNLPDLEQSWMTISLDYKLEILKGLSEMEFMFVAVMVNCSNIRDSDINFEMVYKDYHELCMSGFRASALEKTAMKKCFENLINLHLVGIKKQANVGLRYQVLQCYVQSHDLKEVIKCRNVSTEFENYILTLCLLLFPIVI